jgi:hypothetical protein
MTSETLSRKTPSGDPADTDRRGFLRRASALGAVVVGGIAATWADAPAASASPFCCSLRYPNGPWCGNVKGTNNFTCAKGYTKRYWTCGYMSCEFGCYECTTGSNCHSGTYKCSNYAILVWGGGGC